MQEGHRQVSIYIGQPTLFLAMMLFGFMANAQYFWIVRKLRTAGVRTKSFGTHHDLIQAFRTYRALARERGWQTWPTRGFWLAMAACFGVAIALAASLKAPTPGAFISIRADYVLIWVALTSLAVALWFTRRVIREVPRLQTGERDWRRILRDDYLRSDAYLAVLGWIGPLVAWIVYQAVR